MKILKQVISYILLISIFSNIQAQCGFDIERSKLQQDPNYVLLENEAEERLQNNIATRRITNRTGNILKIPVVIHVLHLGESVGVGSNISDAQIQSSIDNLNDFYRGRTTNSPVDFEIEFTLAVRAPDCSATTGINRIDASSVPNYSTDGAYLQSSGANQETLKDLSRWPESDYFNIWIVSEIDGNNGGSGIQGYANFYNGLAYEGSVMMASVFGYDPGNTNGWDLNSNGDNNVAIHESGHYFHLHHTFIGDNDNTICPTDMTVGENSDGCTDTVPHKRETSTCPTNNNCIGSPWVDNNTIKNIMSYYYCVDRMTNNQKTRVRAAMENTPLVNSRGSIPLDPSYATPVPVCSITTATTIDNHYAGIVKVEMNGNSFSSHSTLNDGGNTDDSENCSNYFEIDATTSSIFNITMFPSNVQQLGMWIDWNDDGDFNDDAEQQYLSNGIAANSVVSIALNYPSSIPYNDYVRVRLITELDDSYGLGLLDSPCYSNLVYGQSEDYAIHVAPTLSIEDNEITGLKVYTELNTKKLVVEGELINNTIVDLYDMHGRLVLSKKLEQLSNYNLIDTSIVTTGVYILKIHNSNQTKSQKVVIK